VVRDAAQRVGKPVSFGAAMQAFDGARMARHR
jgi:hypothetical protein